MKTTSNATLEQLQDWQAGGQSAGDLSLNDLAKVAAEKAVLVVKVARINSEDAIESNFTTWDTFAAADFFDWVKDLDRIKMSNLLKAHKESTWRCFSVHRLKGITQEEVLEQEHDYVVLAKIFPDDSDVARKAGDIEAIVGDTNGIGGAFYSMSKITLEEMVANTPNGWKFSVGK
jgi:hypothetical protein